MASGQKLLDINANGDVFVKDGQGNTVRITQNGVLQGGANLGGFNAIVNFSPSGIVSETLDTLQNVPGMVNQNITTTVTGPHLITLHYSGFANASGVVDHAVAINIDDDTQVIEFPASSFEDTTRDHISRVLLVPSLSAGLHTIRPQWRKIVAAGTAIQANTSDTWSMHIQALGAAISGLEVLNSVVAADLTVSTSHPTFQVTGHTVTFTAIEGEKVEIKYQGSLIGVGAQTNAVFGYKVNGGSVQKGFQQSTDSSTRDQVNFSIMTDALTAGTNTIELMVAKGTATNFIISGNAPALGIDNRMQVVRFPTTQATQGEVQEIQNDNDVSATLTSAQTVFTDIHSTVLNKTSFNLQAGGPYLILYRISSFSSGGDQLATARYRLIFDEGLPGEQIVEPGTSGAGWQIRYDDDFDHQIVTLTGVINNLSTGIHTVTAQWRYIAATGTADVKIDASDVVALHLLSASPAGGGSGGGGGGSGRREIWQITSGTNPPASGTFGASLSMFTALSFDASVNEDVILQVPLPDNIDITADASIVVKYSMNTSDAGAVKLNLNYVIADLAEDIDPASVEVSTSVTPTPGSGVDLLRSTTFTIPSAQLPSVDGVIFARLTRDASNGADTHTGELQLLSIELGYTVI